MKTRLAASMVAVPAGTASAVRRTGALSPVRATSSTVRSCASTRRPSQQMSSPGSRTNTAPRTTSRAGGMLGRAPPPPHSGRVRHQRLERLGGLLGRVLLEEPDRPVEYDDR